ncbi:hypothetical protein Q2T40_12220 [Winogradskyella maritima]|uniref:DUF1735 domain-containing protein n=1 Tax=Winogradskyella maritima TaxID=1517766 RepID=A0ABV8AHA3_9FLAO|nr:hypothetical protein [Winogradskyella maritima]
MKATKHIILLGILLFSMGCSDDDDKTLTPQDPAFVRFFLLVDNDGNPLEYPQFNGGLVPVTSYDHQSVLTLKIPVALTASSVSGNVTVNFETEQTNLSGISISPQNAVTFTPERLVDTIRVSITERWDPSANGQLKFNLISASDSNITIGMPNTNLPNDELIVNFNDFTLNYRFPADNQQEIIGEVGESKTFSVEFPNGYIASEISGLSLFEETTSDFAYSISQLPLNNLNRIDYTFTVNEDIQTDELQFRTRFTLNDIDGYNLAGNPNYTFIKPFVAFRDNATNTANNFYNLSDPFYRTFGEHWFDFNEDAICSWQTFFAFTFPVVVDADHPNAVLFDNMGTTEPEDDIYHHAFRIGFDSPNTTGTTNSFDMRRWFDNESSSQDNSPGFNITEAIEFFPTDGTSTTDGFVQVIEQDLLISNTNGEQFILSISGGGTYSEISPGLFEIILELTTANSDLFGGTRTDLYRIYNSNSYPEPLDLTENCNDPITL